MTTDKTPLAKHPLYQRLLERLTRPDIKTDRFPTESDINFHVTGRLYEKPSRKKE